MAFDDLTLPGSGGPMSPTTISETRTRSLFPLTAAVFGVRSRPGFVPGSQHGGIYAETFALWLVVFVGFAPSFYLRGYFQSPPLPTLWVMHGVAFSTWMVLVLTQSLLVRAGQVQVHRRLGIAGAGESENVASFKNCDLRDDMGCGAESVKAEPFGIAAFAQSAKPNQARTQQRRGRDIIELIGKTKTKAGIDDREFRVTPVYVVAGESRTIAKIFPAGSAKFASPASPTQPRNADAIARAKCFYRATNLLDPANNFMAGN
jgi:hypothetical protein